MLTQIGSTSPTTGRHIQNLVWISPVLQYLASQEHLLGQSIHAVRQSQHWRPWGGELKISPKYLGQAPGAGLGASLQFATHGLLYFPNPSPALALVTCMPKQPINNLLGSSNCPTEHISTYKIIFSKCNISHSLCTQKWGAGHRMAYLCAKEENGTSSGSLLRASSTFTNCGRSLPKFAMRSLSIKVCPPCTQSILGLATTFSQEIYESKQNIACNILAIPKTLPCIKNTSETNQLQFKVFKLPLYGLHGNYRD